MSSETWLTDQFETTRPQLRAVAYRMLGSSGEADDAVQEAWLRVNRASTDQIENLTGWLTTIVSRICLDMLRARRARREEFLDGGALEPVITLRDAADPEQEALTADAVGIALLVLLETLTPSERLAFVLHDMFGVPFDEIAPIVERSPEATRQLASRARRRVRGADPEPTERSLTEQRRVVEAFLAASREGDFDGLVAVLDPNVVLRADRGPLAAPDRFAAHGPAEVAQVILERGTPFAARARHAVVDGRAGAAVVMPSGRVISVVRFTVSEGRVTAIDLVLDPDTLRRLRL
jgi:RNA polymerase sigma factor (sigma-70 family)